MNVYGIVQAYCPAWEHAQCSISQDCFDKDCKAVRLKLVAIFFDKESAEGLCKVAQEEKYPAVHFVREFDIRISGGEPLAQHWTWEVYSSKGVYGGLTEFLYEEISVGRGVARTQGMLESDPSRLPEPVPELESPPWESNPLKDDMVVDYGDPARLREGNND